jgi:predicted nucleic acid-binding protein
MTWGKGSIGRGVLVDASAFVGGLDADDQWHRVAAKGFQDLDKLRVPVFTTNLIAAEVYALARYRLGFDVAFGWVSALRQSVTVVHEVERHTPLVLRALRSGARTRLSYADALSFVIMSELKLNTVFTFDRDFLAHGWQIYPDPLG